MSPDTSVTNDFPQADELTGPLLTVKDLRTTFSTPRGSLTAVDGVSLELGRGETLGIVGESGSGKTVLSRSIMGLLPRSKTTQSGSILFEGTEIVGAPDAALREIWGAKIAMVFQDPMTSLNPVVRIERQITESLRLHTEMDKAEAKATAISLLGQVGIPSPAERVRAYPFQLSGGMRQRVTIAIALACSPRLLLADEPTTGLDVTVQAQILDLLSSMQAERHMAVILVTHDLAVVKNVSDRVAVMYLGRLCEVAPSDDLYALPAHPYTQALLSAVVEPDPEKAASHVALTGEPPSPINPPSGCRFRTRCPKAEERCANEVPELREIAPRHQVACHFPTLRA